MTKQNYPFTPDWASPPGETIADALEELNWTRSQLAEHLGYTEQYVHHLINAQVPINEDLAQKLSQAIGSTPEFWLRREAQYQAQLNYLREKEHLQAQIS